MSLSSKIWNLGFKTETLLANRIINRIEENPLFTQNQKYTFVQGGSLNIRGRYYQPKTNENIDSYTLSAPYIPWHLPSKTYKFYTTSDYFGDDFDIFWRFINPNNLNLNDSLIQYLSYKSQPWPHLNSIYIDNNSIILTLTPKGMWDAQKWIKNFY